MSLKSQGQMFRKKEIRAQRERDIAYECGKELERRRCESEIKVNEVLRQIASVEAEIKRLYASNPNDPRITELGGRIVSMKKDLQFKQGIYDELDRLYELMNALVDKIDACISLGWYKFVIKTVPEKKLPRLISSEKASDMMSVMSLVTLILRKIENRIEEDSKNKEIIDARNDSIVAKERENHAARIASRNAEASAEIARILGASAAAEIPAPVANANQDEEENSFFNRA